MTTTTLITGHCQAEDFRLGTPVHRGQSEGHTEAIDPSNIGMEGFRRTHTLELVTHYPSPTFEPSKSLAVFDFT